MHRKLIFLISGKNFLNGIYKKKNKIKCLCPAQRPELGSVCKMAHKYVENGLENLFT